ncbi:MAG: hypothetical protein AAGC85_12060 [Bacteroidota bacterium]
MAKLIIHRKLEISSGLSGYTILIDGEDMGTVAMNAKREFDLSPGTHTVQAKVDWWSSPVHTVNLKEGEKYQLSISAGGKLELFLLLCFVISSFGELNLIFSDPKAFLSNPLNVVFLIAVSIGFGALLYGITVGRKYFLSWGSVKRDLAPATIELN